MNALRVARAAARARPSGVRLPLQRRAYADAVSDKIKLTLALPHQVSTSQCVVGVDVNDRSPCVTMNADNGATI